MNVDVDAGKDMKNVGVNAEKEMRIVDVDY
jgi:hypothetical protein